MNPFHENHKQLYERLLRHVLTCGIPADQTDIIMKKSIQNILEENRCQEQDPFRIRPTEDHSPDVAKRQTEAAVEIQQILDKLRQI